MINWIIQHKLISTIITVVVVGVGLSSLSSETNNNNGANNQITANQNKSAVITKTITIPSLAEYDDDATENDQLQNIKNEAVAVPSNYTVFSTGNATVNNPVGSEALISEVIDGDTVKLSDGNKVRILAIDTPETKDPRKPVQCFGAEASKKMTELVNGKKVTLILDAAQGDKDKYGRLLRYIYIGSTDIGRELVQEGYAFAYLKYPTSKTDEYKSLENQARESKRGLWAEDTCNGSTVMPSTSMNANTSPTISTQPQINTSPPSTNTSQNKNISSSNLNCSCSSNIYNCPDFSTHAEAQALYDCCIQKVGYDVHRLDGNDNDGLACESLP